MAAGAGPRTFVRLDIAYSSNREEFRLVAQDVTARRNLERDLRDKVLMLTQMTEAMYNREDRIMDLKKEVQELNKEVQELKKLARK